MADAMHLETAIQTYYEKILHVPPYSNMPHLVLELEPNRSVSEVTTKYKRFFSPLELNLSLPSVQELRKKLMQNRTPALFKGEFSVRRKYLLVHIGILVGKIMVDSKSYQVQFVSRPASTQNLRLQYISQ